MNLKDFLASREKPPELYWSLVIEPGWVQAGIWYIGETEAEVVSVSPGAAWETEDELIGASDAALSSSVQQLPEDYPEPSKTVFGVPSAWVKNGEIQEEFLSKIKNICTELSLNPVGFVVIPEAIAHLYKSQEGSPLSAIIIGLGKEFLEVTAFKLGNLVGTTSVSRSVSLIEDVTEGLTRFKEAQPLPSRIIVYDGKGGELEEAKEALMQATWEEEKIKFLHTPKVETITSDKKVIATSLAGAAEIGKVSKVSTKEEEVMPPAEEVENLETPEEDLTPDEIGFVVGEDVSATAAPKIQEKVFEQKPVNIPPPQPKITTTSFAGKVKNILKKLPTGFITGPKIKTTPSGKKNFVAVPIIFGILLIAAAISWWFLPKANVTIFVSPKNFSQDVNISFSVNGKDDPAGGIIPATALNDQVSGDKTKATTGTKLIGDKANGSVTISNGNPNAINLAAGTFIASSGGLKFTLGSEASVSGQLLPGSPGTASVNVSANDIGAQYNLAKGEIFSVGNFSKSLVAAVSQADFAGGSSQEIPAVNKEDQTSLEDSLKSELTDKAKNDLQAKVDASQIFTDLADTKIVSETFDHKIGEQADNLKLSLNLNVTGIAADREKLLSYARGILKDKIPQGYVLRDSQISFKFTFVDSKDGLYNYKVTLSANFLPQVNTDSIISQIAGKTPKVAENYLDSIPGFNRAEVKVTPSLPSFLQTLPHERGNITIDVTAEQ